MQDFVDFVMRLWADLLARPRGPFAFRLAVQPMIALLLAIALDVIYQLNVRGWVYPGEALGIALLLALFPYSAMRGPEDRIACRWIARQTSRQKVPEGAPPARTT